MVLWWTLPVEPTESFGIWAFASDISESPGRVEEQCASPANEFEVLVGWEEIFYPCVTIYLLSL